MNTITQYRPAFFEGFENETAEFDSLKSLMEIPFVKGFSDGKGFYQFSYSDEMLMAEFHEGTEWLVVGRMREPVLGLPKWYPIDERNYSVSQNSCQSEPSCYASVAS